MTVSNDYHPSHDVRFSDSSQYDFKCSKCGATDATNKSGYCHLYYPCNKSEIQFLKHEQ